MELLEQIKQINIFQVAEDLGFKIVHNRKILCPFHEEDKASLVFYPLPQNEFHCFGCGRHGDVINFYADVNNIDFKEALRQLTQKYVPNPDAFKNTYRRKDSSPEKINFKPTILPRKEKIVEKSKETQALHSNIYETFAQFCLDQNATPIAHEAFHYLTNRGIWEKTIRQFRLFVIKDYALVNHFLRHTFSFLDLQEAGLCNERNNLVFFKHPFIIPYYEHDRIIFLQGRVIGTPPENASKYQFLNGVSRPIFNLDSLKTLKTNSKLYITEGAIDCITLVQNGYPAISLGSASTFKKEWAKYLKRFEVRIAFDNDETGQKSAAELEEKLTDAGITIGKRLLPSGVKDINEYFLKK